MLPSSCVLLYSDCSEQRPYEQWSDRRESRSSSKATRRTSWRPWRLPGRSDFDSKYGVGCEDIAFGMSGWINALDVVADVTVSSLHRDSRRRLDCVPLFNHCRSSHSLFAVAGERTSDLVVAWVRRPARVSGTSMLIASLCSPSIRPH